MGRYIKALAAAIGLWLAVPATALAGPAVVVSVGLPRPVIVAPAPVYMLNLPGPDYVWVAGGYRYDAFGRLVWVPAHWVIVRPYVTPHPVVVRDRHDHDRHGHLR